MADGVSRLSTNVETDPSAATSQYLPLPHPKQRYLPLNGQSERLAEFTVYPGQRSNFRQRLSVSPITAVKE